MSQATQAQGFASAAEYEDVVMAEVRILLDARVVNLLRSGAPLPSPAELAYAMAAGIPDAPDRLPYAQLLGPFYSSAGAMRLLGIPSKQALADRRKRGTILAAQTSDGVWAYPSFQFDIKTRRVRPALTPILAALKNAPRWGASLWLVTGHPELGSHSPLQASQDPTHHALVVRLAEQYASAVADG